MLTLMLILAGCVALGFAIARWWSVLIPVAGVLIFYLTLWRGWWGDGIGDDWVPIVALLAGAVATCTAAGVVVRRLVSGASRPVSS
jgi:hypothetical protein